MRLKFLLFLLLPLATACASAQEEMEPAVVAAADTPVVASARTPEADPENTLYLDLTTGGRVAIRLRPDVAPNHVERIKTLARQGFYDGITFHRVIDGFMAQTGDPEGTGQGGSSLPDLAAEFNTLPHVRGAVSMARTNEPDSANSQFFIMFMPRLALDRNYTVFGRVVDGMEFVDAIPRGEPPADPARIVRASIAADNVPPPTPAEVAAVQNQAAPGSDPAAAIREALEAGTGSEEPETAE